MKILYISKGDHVDYQDDCLCIGLKELFGSDVVDINKRHHIYDSYDIDAASKLYGMGMSVTRILEDLDIDREDIGSKIKNKYFDYIIYGSIWRCSDYIEEIVKYYSPEKILVVDGEDETNIHRIYNITGIRYYKRELVYNMDRLYPISFAIPACKLNFHELKNRDYAICDPRDKSTYIYNNETDYYNGYGEARFAYTMKKAGWDCMRHYEILANGCIPIFLNIENCPNSILTNFPKYMCSLVERSVNGGNLCDIYDDYIPVFKDIVHNNLTTEMLAKNIISSL